MSELFLDEQVNDQDYAHVARVAAQSGYTDEELDRIFLDEVAPVLHGNLLSVAGEWMLFPRDWLEERILEQRGIGYWFARIVSWPVVRLTVWDDWKRVKELLTKSCAWSRGGT